MKKILVNYNHYPDLKFLGNDYLIYDRSDNKDFTKELDPQKVIYTRNIGQVDFDKLTYLIDFYETLPEVFLWGKTNLFKFITPEEWKQIENNTTFTPVLTQGHKTYSDSQGVVSYYDGGMYHERNDSWYVHSLGWKYFQKFYEFANAYRIPSPHYIPFPPGGNFILTREVVYKYGRDFYKELRDLLPYAVNPSEAHMLERAYYLIWR